MIGALGGTDGPVPERTESAFGAELRRAGRLFR
jgi:hypothetical protein